MLFEHFRDYGAELLALVGEPDADRALVMDGTFLDQVLVLDHLLDVIRDVRAEIIPADRKLAHRQLVIADIEQDHRLDVVDVLNIAAVQLDLKHIEKAAVQAFDQLDGFVILMRAWHGVAPDCQCDLIQLPHHNGDTPVFKANFTYPRLQNSSPPSPRSRLRACPAPRPGNDPYAAARNARPRKNHARR